MATTRGLKVPKKQRKRGRLWFNDGSCVRLAGQSDKDHVWAYDFLHARTRDGRSFRLLAIIDEFTRECLAIDVARKLNHDDVLERSGLADGHARRAGPSSAVTTAASSRHKAVRRLAETA